MVETASVSPDTIRSKMLRRIVMGGACIAIIFTSLIADAITLTAVQSRKTHGTVGAFDLSIDTAAAIGGNVTVEPRMIGSGHQLAFQFDTNITATGFAAAFDDAGVAIGVVTAVAAGSEVVVTLTGIADNKRVTVQLAGVNNALDVSVSVGFMVGDVNNTRSVNSSDISGVKARSGQLVDAANFRFDLNGTGSVNSSDISAVKARSGTSLPPVTAGTTYLLSVSRNGNGAGTVSSSPLGIGCGVNCSSSFNAGSVVALTATAASGSSFAGWGGACTGTGTCNVTMDAVKSVTASFTVNGVVIPPDPSTVAPPTDPTVATNITTATAFLYTGVNPIQTGVTPGTIEVQRVAVLRGKVQTRDGAPLSGVAITILAHPEFGQTFTRADGAFDLAVNGGGPLTLRYEKNSFLRVQRAIVAPWRDYAWLPDVVMIPFDTAVTAIDLSVAGATGMQVARGSPMTDADGARRATILFPPGTTATMLLPGGSTQPLTTLNVRATEYTVGASGPRSMPAPLPANSAYTYAVELSVDEVVAAGATEVRFSQALPVYVENFLGFPVGSLVPAGYLDRQSGQWIASANGRVIKVLSITNNLADLDTDGDGLIDDATKLAALGVTTAEQANLALLYTVGQTLWRVPLTHFTPWDFNWPFGPPPDAIPPPGWSPFSPIDDPCITFGSIIGCENQSLGEAVPVTGTPMQLTYRSERTPGRKEANRLDIRLSGATVPASLKRIELEVTVAGKKYVRSFGPSQNLVHTFVFDGKDAFGRNLQGPQRVTVRSGYVYKGVYLLPSQRDALIASESQFGHYSFLGTPVSANRDRLEVTLWQEYNTRVGPWDNRALGLGGWSLSAQHAYDPFSRTLLLGNGRQRSAEALPAVIYTVAGTGVAGYIGVDIPATSARLNVVAHIAVGADGSLYIGDLFNSRIFRVRPDGIITTVAGSGISGYGGDGGPATAAKISPMGIAVSPDGTLFIADWANARIRRVGTDGIITTVAGNGTNGFSGDGGPATAAKVSSPHGVAVGLDGSLYIADSANNRIRRVGTDGIITTVAGNGNDFPFGGDGGPATAATLSGPDKVTVGQDGSVFIVDTGNRLIRRVGPDGIISTVAGDRLSRADGDGGPATAAQLSLTRDVAVGPDGSLYIADDSSRIRRVGPDGVINTVVGTTVAGYSGDGGPATAAQLNAPAGVAVAPDSSLYIGERLNYRVRRVHSALPDGGVADHILTSEDGREIYVFNNNGRHLRTLDALTGTVQRQFAYDASGYLATITDGSGNVTIIERTSGAPTAIIAPGGQRTSLVTDAGGWLLTVTNPASEVHTMSYSAEGLMQNYLDPRGNNHGFTYDALGRLTRDDDPAGGSSSLVRTEQSGGHTVTITSALGRSRSFQLERLPTGTIRRTITSPSGAQTVTLSNPDGTQTVTSPDGMQVTAKLGPDPRFGMLAPRLVQRTRTIPGGPTETITGARSVTLSDPNNILSLQSLTDSVSINGRTFANSYDGSTRTLTSTSAEYRRVISVLDAQGRVVSRTPAAGITPISVAYDSQGRITEHRQGVQSWTYAYDARNRVMSRIDAAGHSASFLYDNADRITQTTLPGGEIYQFIYDASGNRTRLILPGGASHVLGYTAIDLDASYTPPDNASYLRSFNLDRQLTRTTLPTGRFTDQSRDLLGRVNGMSYPEAAASFEYLAADLTDRVLRITHTPVTGPAQDIAFNYTGNLISGMTATGAAPAQVAYTYNNDFFTTNMNFVSGADNIQSPLIWDKDGLLKGFGPFTFTRNGPRGAVSQVSDAASTTNHTYDSIARVANRNHLVNAVATYAMQLSYDTTGRVTGRTETQAGTTVAFAYTYDLSGRLTEVRRDSVLVERYTYALNGNRTSRQLGAGPVESASFDSQDRLIQRGAVNYQFNADGFLSQRGADTFQYSTRGHLLTATVGGQAITYAYDGMGRRVGRTNTAGTYQYLYGDPASHLVTAVRAPGGELTALFYNPAGLVIAIERGGARYYVMTDQVGTPRVVSSSAGALVKVLEFDSFGNMTFDSNAAFDLPIGFAGGLADAASGLVHFAKRDYDPAAGRWASRDPALFGGGQGNLYAYARNSPVAFRDPTGLFCISATAYEGIGGGVGFCITDEGASVCGELGFGVGASVGADADGGLEKTGTQLLAEASYQVGIAKIGAGVSLDSGGCLSATGKGQVGPITAEVDSSGSLSKGGLDLDIEGSPKIGGGAEAKIAAKGCIQGKF